MSSLWRKRQINDRMEYNMNERIRELMIDAGLGPISGFETGRGMLESSYEKFAELIVRDCIEAARTVGGSTGVEVETIIRNHFGVE